MNPTACPAASHRQPPDQRHSLLARMLARSGVATLAADRSGATAIIIGLLSMGLLGFTALGTEVTYWYFVHRDLQNAADSAALSAVAALENIGGSPDDTHKKQATAEAIYDAQQYGFSSGTGGVSLLVNIPPVNGNYKTQPNAVEVVLSEPQSLFLSAALSINGQPLFATNPTQSVRAVATPASNGNGCVVSLDTAQTVVGLGVSGSTNVNLSGCNLYINSDDSTAAFDATGNATVTAESAFITGGITDSGKAALNTTTGPFHTAPIADPYANVLAPYISPGSTCSGQSQSNVSGAIPPASGSIPAAVTGANGAGTVYVFCGGWHPQNNVTLQPGIYVVDGGSLQLSGSTSISCPTCVIGTTGVTIYLTGSGTNYATMQLSGQSSINLTPPVTGPTAGITIFQDRNAPKSTSSQNQVTGGSTLNITGVIYFPNQGVTYSGGSTTTGPACEQIVALTLTFTGNSLFQNDCFGNGNNPAIAGVAGIGAIPAHLVE